jgi:hypothetical protein
MNYNDDDFELNDVPDNHQKMDRKRRLETQRRIYELKEQQKLKRELESYFDEY